MLESLEQRTMLSVEVAGATLIVNGTSYDDYIVVTRNGPGSYTIMENDITQTVTSYRTITRVVIQGQGGHDFLMLDKTTPKVRGFLYGNNEKNYDYDKDGDDTLVGGYGPDLFDGGGGFNTADYSYRNEPLRLSLNGVADDGAYLKSAEGDNLYKDIQSIIGGSSYDLIIGDKYDNELLGGYGNDTIYGRDGNDTIFGEDGDDYLDGGDGHDLIAGNDGKDYILGGYGDDELFANDYEKDTVFGGDGHDTAYVDPGLDTVVAEYILPG